MPQSRQGFANIAIETATCAARRVTHMGRSFRVVPAVLVRSQVLRNNLGTTFLPAEEITDDWAAQWNNIPVLVGAHPGVTGRTPETMNERCVGWIFNARAETAPDGTRRLVGDVYLDESRADSVTGFKAVLARLDEGAPVELSTGFATQTDETTGSHNGESYELVLHPVGADHLVISTDMTGACSIQHGCGLGANEEAKVAEDKKTVETDGTKPTGNDTPKPKKQVEEIKGGLKALLSRVGELFGKSDTQTLSWEDHEAMRCKRELALMQLTPSDSERAQMLKEACQEEYGASDRDVVITDVYTQPEQAVIFFFSTPMGPQPKGAEYYKVMWADADNDGIPELKGEPVLVRKQVSYEPVGSGPAGDGAPAGNESPAGKVAEPAVQSHNQEEGTMSDKVEKETGLGELTAAVAKLAEQVANVATKVEAMEKQSAPAEIAGLKRTVGKLAESFEQMRGVTKAAIDERERERQHLVQQLAGNHRVPFSAAELETKPIEELRKLTSMAQSENYAGNGGPQGGRGAEQRYAEPKPYWEQNKKESE